MSNKTVVATIFTTAFLVLIIFGAQVVEVAEANFLPFYNAVINVQSPQNGIAYNRRTISLNFTVESNQEDQLSTRYFLNSEKPVDVDTPVVSSRIATMQVWDGWSSEPNQTKRYVVYTAEGNTILANLADGAYNLTIQRYFTYPVTQEVAIYNATTVTFIIDTTKPLPSITPTQSSFPTFPSPTSTDATSASPTPSAHIPTVPVFLAVVLLIVVLLLFGIVCQRKNRHT